MFTLITMSSTLKWLKLLADPTRVRIVRVLSREKLSVAELQEILAMGQSRISSQLAQLKSGGLVEDERSGKHIFYQLSHPSGEKTRAGNEFERHYLMRIMRATAGNVTVAARKAGKERRAFGKLLKKHHLDRSTFARPPMPSSRST